MEVFWRIVRFLHERAIGFELIAHQPAGPTAFASEVRGHDLAEAAKSLVVQTWSKGRDTSPRRFALAVLPGDRRLDFAAISRLLNADRVHMASETDVERLTGCVPGAVPPFSFNDELMIIVDDAIEDQARMIFNAGRLDRSIIMRTESYLAGVTHVRQPVSMRAGETATG